MSETNSTSDTNPREHSGRDVDVRSATRDEQFAATVRRLLAEGESEPAIAAQIAGYSGYYSLGDLLAAIDRIDHERTADTVERE